MGLILDLFNISPSILYLILGLVVTKNSLFIIHLKRSSSIVFSVPSVPFKKKQKFKNFLNNILGVSHEKMFSKYNEYDFVSKKVSKLYF